MNLAIGNACVELLNRFRYKNQLLQSDAFKLLPYYVIHFTNSLP